MMIELNKYMIRSEKREPSKAKFSLSGKLEGIIGNYFVSGEGAYNKDLHWLTVYYDSSIDTYTEAVELVPSNIVAYVSSDYRWGFVLSSHIHIFNENVSDYGISCIAIPSFEDEILQCSHTNLLPCEFSDIVWIDDDFMDDENIPFDHDSFALIDEGVNYLNPKHFSVVQLIMTMESANK
ncbi:MAG: transposase [Lachnospiraceae bacterium]|nr:transposase [Lachnospiraceae bacterium]